LALTNISGLRASPCGLYPLQICTNSAEMQEKCGEKCVSGPFYSTTFSNSEADSARKSAFLSNHAGSPVQALLKMGMTPSSGGTKHRDLNTRDSSPVNSHATPNRELRESCQGHSSRGGSQPVFRVRIRLAIAGGMVCRFEAREDRDERRPLVPAASASTGSAVARAG